MVGASPALAGSAGEPGYELRTEFPFIPPRDPRVRENESYLTVLLLSRVVTRLGRLPEVNPGVIENMFASDLAFLQDLYRRVNQEGTSQAAVTCPSCQHEFTVEMAGDRLGGS